MEKKVKINLLKEKGIDSIKHIMIFCSILGISFALLEDNAKLNHIGYFIFVCILILGTLKTLGHYKLINNKNMLILLVPIVLLSINNLVFSSNNEINKFANFLMFFIFVFRVTKENFPVDKSQSFFNFLLDDLASSLNNLSFTINDSLNEKEAYKNIKKVMLGLLIAIPFLFVLTILLVSADLGFQNLLDNLDIADAISNILFFSIVFFISLVSGVFVISLKDRKNTRTNKRDLDKIIISTFLICLNLLFLVFCIVQFKYIILGTSPVEYLTYAQYAREGFFQLLLASVINFVVIFVIKSKTHTVYTSKLVNNLMIILCMFTILLIGSSFKRMSLYIGEYGFTTLRISVVLFLILETSLVVIYIISLKKPKWSIVKISSTLIILALILNSAISNNAVTARLNYEKFKGDTSDKYEITSDNFHYLVNQGVIESYNEPYCDSSIPAIDSDNIRSMTLNEIRLLVDYIY